MHLAIREKKEEERKWVRSYSDEDLPSWHLAPKYPLTQRQDPVTESQDAPCKQLQLREQSGPNLLSGHSDAKIKKTTQKVLVSP